MYTLWRRQGTGACNRRAGFTLVEVLMAIVIIGIVAGAISIFQRNTWKSTRRTNNMVLAGQLVMQKIESMRANINRDSTTYWPPASGSAVDSTTKIALSWTVSTVADPTGATIAHVRGVRYVASWTVPKTDSVAVQTYLSHDF